MGFSPTGASTLIINHLLALLDLCAQRKVPKVSVHVFTDGRDTPPDSGAGYVKRLLEHPTFNEGGQTRATVASLSGRYYAMDRDKRWDRRRSARTRR